LKPAVAPPAVTPAPKTTAPAPKSIDAALNPTPAPKASGGAASVQIGAFSSQALADKGWADAARIAPGAAAGKGKSVQAIQKDGSTLYRTQVTGFASRADAAAFCSQLKAAGKSCFVK
jgi:cell division protein FtsN